MPYQNNMGTLADVVSPAYAALQAGIQNDAANQQQQLENEKAQAALPFVGPRAQADLAAVQANTGETQARTQGLGLANQFTQQTQPGKVAATNTGNAALQTAEQAKNLGSIGQIAGQVAGMMDGVPPPARPAAFAQVLKSYGVDASHLPQEFLTGDPDLLRNFSQKAIQASAEFQTQTGIQEQKNQGSLAVAQTGAESRVRTAELNAQARQQVAEINRQAKIQSQTFEQAAVEAEKRGDHAGAQKFYQAAQNIRQYAAQTTASLIGQNVPNPGFGGGEGGAPSSGGGQPAPAAGPALNEAAKASFGAYEPDKYDYRVGPNGNLQRKPK